ncbi:hypothetical protein [Pontibacter oryzae]|uniref:Glycosyl hydrolase family 98 putative carbohydrate-binding module domain-containing protein n=1 Tax=Pontibacter oryzae TaxID=2304593 RepID=A0A399SJ93_9BACT|nr:hypothetical protein [Pontibacter oryzae]RIJ42979.1 hypothetical protein D1627_03850 [Pontibacter oryzae]
MKKFTLSAMACALLSMVSMGCSSDQSEEANPFAATLTKNFGTDPSSCEIIEFDELTPTETSAGAVTTVFSQDTPVRILAQYRLGNGRYAASNAALLFNTSRPDAKNKNFRTPSPAAIRPMGDVLTVGRSNSKFAKLYDKGSRIELDFSAMGSINLKGIHVLDITEEEANSKVELLDKNGKVIKTMALPVTGAYGATRLRIDTPGVAKLRVIFGDETSRRGGGAIDVIEFCRE